MIGSRSYSWHSFQPFVYEEAGAGCVLLGMRCCGCHQEFSSADLESDTKMFRQVVNHDCSEDT